MAAVVALLICVLSKATGIPAEPYWFDQTIDHFSTDVATFKQRYYINSTHFGGPGSPIFLVVGGEGGIPPEAGIFYPWVTDVLAKEFHALVVEPEHRFYGASLPYGNKSFSQESLRVMDSQQALADTANFIRFHQQRSNCTARGTKGYCPVLTIGGSYPGFLSAMMRLRYPAVVDMAYAASAPMRFYSQEVGQYEYYDRITASAERALQGCAAAVLKAFDAFTEYASTSTIEQTVQRFQVCSPLPAQHAADKDLLQSDIVFLAEQTFANLNMANYPPDSSTGLARTCAAFVEGATKGVDGSLDAVRNLLLKETQKRFDCSFGKAAFRVAHDVDDADSPGCFDLAAAIPAGPHATGRCGDWSGCGVGHDGEMWDYQTCSFEVEHIGFNNESQMFPSRAWSFDWLRDHCKRRFGIEPQPYTLNALWGFDAKSLPSQTTRILFTNGLNDGWSVGGFLDSLSPERDIISMNFPNGAHHSDLAHGLYGPKDTPDIIEGHAKAVALIGKWLHDIQREHMSINHMYV